MPTDTTAPEPVAGKADDHSPVAKKPPASVAERALAEAAARRAERDREATSERPKEIGGPNGPEPTRYGDWEVNGITSDF
jgi:hypothetical protein